MDDGYGTCGIVRMTELGMGHCENDPTAICTRSFAKVELGLLARSDDPNNRRQVRVSVTGLGTQTLEQLRELSTRQLRMLFAEVSDDDLETITRAIHIMADAASASVAGADVAAGAGVFGTTAGSGSSCACTGNCVALRSATQTATAAKRSMLTRGLNY